MKQTRVIGIIVVYYAAYLDSALNEFSNLLERLSDDSMMIVVSTNEKLKITNKPRNSIFIYGNNSLREFSGWESGLAYCRINGLVEGSRLVVFANDTFCHHNKYGLLTRLRFVSVFKRASRNAEFPILAGEIHGFGHQFTICGVTSSVWVCTYLFALTGELIKRMEGILPKDNLTSVTFGHTQESFISGNLSSNLASHICSWLLGDGPTKWYGKKNITPENRDSLVGKAKSILCEKYLTAGALAAGATIISVFRNPLYRQLRRLESLSQKARNPH